LAMRRRDVLRGGLGVMTTVALTGMQRARDEANEPKPEEEPEVQAAPEPEEDSEPTEEAAPTEEPDEPAESADDDSSEAPESDEEPDTDGEEEEEPEPEPEHELYRRGDSGDGVLALQQQLSSTGYWLGTPDGGFGHLTQQAVFALQKAHGLSRDGVAGPNVHAAAAKGYLPKAVGGGDLIEVHLNTQLLHVVRGGKTTMVLNTSTASGEKYEFKGTEYTARTRTGDFQVGYVDGSGWRDGELGEMWRPMFYSGNYAVHGSKSIPPWPASHGCSRLSVAAMDMIWKQGLMSMGSRVLVT
ncbi:MAG: L,D-transpeptidase family protein, partial [Ornithinimicrobium sp.]